MAEPLLFSIQTMLRTLFPWRIVLEKRISRLGIAASAWMRSNSSSAMRSPMPWRLTEERVG